MVEQSSQSLSSTACKALEECYGLVDVEITPLPGVAPTNFKVESKKCKYFLKRYQVGEKLVAQFHAALLVHYEKNLIPIASVVPLTSGDLILSVDDSHYVLQQYLSSPPLSELPVAAERLAEAGRLLGRIHQCGGPKDIECPYLGTLWNMENLDKLLALIEKKKNKFTVGSYAVVDSFARKWRRERPDFTVLDRTFIHNDFHKDNMLFEGNRCEAVIDFGESVPGCRIVDVAVSLMYLSSLESPPNKVFSQFLRGYSEIYSITEQERRYLPLLVRARAVITFALNRFEYNRSKDGAFRVLVNEDLETYLS
ncbi:MAG: phosphotransferase [Cyanobacteria bacterium J06638_6]